MGIFVGITLLYYLFLMIATEIIRESETDAFRWGRFFMILTLSTNMWLLSPSISYVIFLYLPLHLTAIIFMIARNAVGKGELT